MRGKSIDPSSCATCPHTRASYLRVTLRERKREFMPRKAALVRANTTRPEVSIPNRWTTILSMRPDSDPKRSKTALFREALDSSFPGTVSTPDGLLTTTMWSSSCTITRSSLEIALEAASFDFIDSSPASCLALTSAAATAWFRAEPERVTTARFWAGANAETDATVTASAERLHRRRIVIFLLLIEKRTREYSGTLPLEE
mmetsp:Transcript_20838/g.45177  ORF Transcript_20838/g.45177 Transcript_20838/m.45177 type:complete len:201 (-) Transcript_20838:76-678(-)